MPSAGSPIQIGQTLAERYHVTAQLGQGGMATVYRAIDTERFRDVVIKFPHAAQMESEEFAARFRHEIRALIEVSHPHIVKVLDVDVHEGLLFGVLQFLPGGSLEDRQRPCPPADVLEWLSDVAEALDFMHDRGLIHRDVKPANILLDDSGEAYLADFGIAKALAESDWDNNRGLTGAGMVIGTAEFMAPEMLMPDHYSEQYNERVDQYALAVTVYVMLSGRHPFNGDTIASVAVNMTQAEPPLLCELQPSVNATLSQVVDRGLMQQPEDRFPSCSAFAKAVAGALVEQPGRVTKVAARPGTRNERRPKPRNDQRQTPRVTAVAQTLQEKRLDVLDVNEMFAVEAPADIDDVPSIIIDTDPVNRTQTRSTTAWLKSPAGLVCSGVAIIAIVIAIVIYGNSANQNQSHNRQQVATYAQNVTFHFDHGAGPEFTNFNEGMLFRIDEDGPNLRIAKPIDDGTFNTNGWVNAGVMSTFAINGDFQATVEFTLRDIPPTEAAERLSEAVFAVEASDGGRFQVLRYRQGNENWMDCYVVSPAKQVAGTTQHSGASTGQFRITRNGSTLTASYAPLGSSSFTPVGRATGLARPLRIQMFAAQGGDDTRRASTALDIEFDNLNIQAEELDGLDRP